MVSDYHAAQPQSVPRRPVIRPVPVDDSGFTVEPDGDGGFVVRGPRPERWIRPDQLRQRRGRRLSRRPPGPPGRRGRTAAPGCTARVRGHHRRHDVRLGAADAHRRSITRSGRGTDVRLERNDRVGADERKAARRSAANALRPRSTVMSSPNREAIRTARSVVVKVGTTALTTPTGMFDASRLAGLVDAIEAG